MIGEDHQRRGGPGVEEAGVLFLLFAPGLKGGGGTLGKHELPQTLVQSQVQSSQLPRR